MLDRLSILPEVQDSFEIAVSHACGADHVAQFREECPVRLSTNWRKYGDMTCAYAKFFFNRHMQENKSRDGDVVVVTAQSISEYGRVREFTYTSPRDVAEAIISFLPEETMGTLIASVHIVDCSAVINITTAAHLQWHLDSERYPCPHCGRFCQGKYGIRTHLVRTLSPFYTVI